MKLSEPKVLTFIIALVIAILGVIAFFIASFSGYAFWILLVAFVLLALANLFKGL